MINGAKQIFFFTWAVDWTIRDCYTWTEPQIKWAFIRKSGSSVQHVLIKNLVISEAG